MSNEELAVQIKEGQTDLIPELWESVERFIQWKSWEYYKQTHGYRLSHGYTTSLPEVDDFVQSGYFAMIKAVEYFSADSGYSFLTFLSYTLKSAFQECIGIRGSRRDLLDIAGTGSFDAPLKLEENSGTLYDVTQDETNNIEDAEQKIWLDQLRSALDTALDRLPEDQRQTLIDRYYKNLTMDQAALDTGCTKAEIRRREIQGLKQLRKEKHITGLEQFVDSQTLFYKGMGVRRFLSTHTSGVEKTVFFREDLRQQYKNQFQKGEIEDD